MPNLAATLEEILAGGPGSGPHPGMSSDKLDKLKALEKSARKIGSIKEADVVKEKIQQYEPHYGMAEDLSKAFVGHKEPPVSTADKSYGSTAHEVFTKAGFKHRSAGRGSNYTHPDGRKGSVDVNDNWTYTSHSGKSTKGTLASHLRTTIYG